MDHDTSKPMTTVFPTSPDSLAARDIYGTPLLLIRPEGKSALGLLRKLLMFDKKGTVTASSPDRPFPLPPT